MARSEYEWEIGSPPPEIANHSLVKHRILHQYLLSYIEILAADPRQETLRLTLVDGFAGGGIYLKAGTTQEHEGSPFVLLRACKEAEFKASERRRKKFSLKVDYFFVEKKKANFLYLKHALAGRGFGDLIDKSIHLFHADVNSKIQEVADFIAKKGRAGRSIFLLDQYGYAQVPGQLIKQILTALPRAEVILTFYVDALVTYLSSQSQGTLKRLGLTDIDVEILLSQKATNRQWRRLIQAKLYKGLIDACGAKYFTPFFIRAAEGHGDYWLIHLSMHQRARGAMVDLHWAENNHFIHFGGAGLNMLGYSPAADQSLSGQQPLDFLFDDGARSRSIAALMSDLPKVIHASSQPMTFEHLFASTCNDTPATDAIYRETLFELMQYKEIDIVGANGEVRRSRNTIEATDRISVARQHLIFPRKA